MSVVMKLPEWMKSKEPYCEFVCIKTALYYHTKEAGELSSGFPFSYSRGYVVRRSVTDTPQEEKLISGDAIILFVCFNVGNCLRHALEMLVWVQFF